jgi:hypothetical protein
MVDLSILKDIDFTNPDNLLFLSIFLVLFIIVVIVFVVTLAKIIKIIRKAIIRIFNIGVKTPKSGSKDEGADLEVVVKELEQSKEERAKIEGQKIVGGDFIRKFDSDEKKSEEGKNKVKSREEKTEKEIAEGLSALKSESSAEGGTLESKMPSTSENQPSEGGAGEIKIPKAKVVGEQKPEEGPGGKPVEKGTAGGTSNIKSVDYSGEGVLGRISDKTEKQGGNNVKISANLGASGAGAEEKGKIGKQATGGKAGIKTGGVEVPVSGGGALSQQPGKDSSIFGGKSEISRSELRQKLEEDTGVFKAGKQAGLNMSPVQRAKLEKEVFSSALGGNISKTDLKLGLKKLNEKLSGAKSSTEHAKIRKEIDFFKKIGNIK